MMINISGEQACALLHAIDMANDHYAQSAIHKAALIEVKSRIKQAEAR